MTAYLDTMVAVWFVHENLRWRLSTAAKHTIAECETLLISPMTIYELKAVYRKKRMEKAPAEVLAALETFGGVGICTLSYKVVAMCAAEIDWTTDPGVAMIVGQAMANGNAALITSDRRIREHYAPTIW